MTTELHFEHQLLRARSHLIERVTATLFSLEVTEFGLEGVLGNALAAAAVQRLEPSFDGRRWIEAAVDWINDHGVEPGLYGLGGLGMVVQLYDPGENELLVSFDNSLLLHLPRLTPGDWHFGHGGLAVYASLRAHAPSGDRLLLALKQEITSAGRLTAQGTLWPLFNHERQRVTMGAAHGHTGTLLGLAILSRAGHMDVNPLIEAGLQTLWRFQRSAPNRFGWFYESEQDKEPKPHRPGSWCWGDPGVLRGAYLAAQVCGDKVSEARALTLAKEDATAWLSTIPPGETGLYGMCCGCSISAHIYRRYYRETKDPVFLAASDHIFAACLEAVDKMEELSFQHGKLGVLLALLYAASDIEPEWDMIRGISLPKIPTTESGAAKYPIWPTK